jgi:CheY-like chemotaxis protein
MMDNLTDLIYFKDRESRFTAVNRLFLCRAGLKGQSEIIGKTDQDLYAEEHASAALADQRKIIAYAIIFMDCQMPEMDGYDASDPPTRANPAGRLRLEIARPHHCHDCRRHAG